VSFYLNLPNYANNLLRLGFSQEDLADGGSDRLVDAIVAWGDADAIRARVQAHRDAGADHVCVQVLHSDTGTLPRAQWRELAGILID
jgi:probable F420-dependent oxidoreductase